MVSQMLMDCTSIVRNNSMNKKRALILEDTQQVSDALTMKLRESGVRHQAVVDVDVVTTQRVTQILNRNLSSEAYDVILLDYYAPDGNFHVLDFQKIDVKNVIAISSMPDKNQLAKSRVVNCSVTKTNPLTDEKTNEIINKAEYILYTNT